MRRITTALVLGLGVLALNWQLAPAAPGAPLTPASVEELSHIDAAAPVASAIDQETGRLRSRLSQRPDPPKTRRDPFTFATPRRPRPTPASEEPAPPPSNVEAAPEPELLWPTLAAIMVDEPSAQPTRTAVVGWGDLVEFLKTGDTFKDFVVVSISSAAIELRHEPTKTLRTVRLR